MEASSRVGRPHAVAADDHRAPSPPACCWRDWDLVLFRGVEFGDRAAGETQNLVNRHLGSARTTAMAIATLSRVAKEPPRNFAGVRSALYSSTTA
jgi:hypothetical protein